MKNIPRRYAVLCRLVDCQEDWGLSLLTPYDSTSPKTFNTKALARTEMKKDYGRLCESYSAEWSANEKDPCFRKVEKDEIYLRIPIWDGEKGEESYIHAKWKIVEL